MLVRKKRGAKLVRGVGGRLPVVGNPSSSTSGRGAGGGGVGGGDLSVGDRRCLDMGGGAASSSLLDGEDERAGSETEAPDLAAGPPGRGCLEWRRQKEKKSRSSRSLFCETALSTS